MILRAGDCSLNRLTMVDHHEERCPHCGVSLQAEPILPHLRGMYGGNTHYSRKIGIEVMGAYDGVLYWRCPDCQGAWHRFEESFYLYDVAKRFVDADNAARTKPPIPSAS